MSLLTRRLTRPSPLIRSHLLISQRQSIRHNSVLNGLGSLVATTAETLSSVHHAGLPWYIVIPLFATGLNFSIRLPAQYMGRVYNLRKKDTLPLKSAWMSRSLQEYKLAGPISRPSLTVALGRVYKEVKRINSDFGAPSWRVWSCILGPMVPFILVSEAIRRLAGSPMTWVGEKLGLDRFLDYLEPGASSLADPTLSEGGLLWFTDLMAADPYGFLPLITTGALGWTVWRRMSAEKLRELLSIDDKNMGNLSRLRNGVGRAMLIVPLFPLLFWNLPCAVFLYWAPTFLFNGVNDKLLQQWLPDRKPRYEHKATNLEPVITFVRIDGYEIPKKGASPGAKSPRTASK